jgi:hypothetical protein
LLALVLLERSLPEDHPDVLSCMEKLGDTFYASEKFKDAAPVYRRLVGIREKNPTANHLTVSALFKLAKTHERLGQIDEAEEQYKRAVKLGEKVPGPLFANLCDAFAGLLKRNGRDAQLMTALEAAARERRDQDGSVAANRSQQQSTLQMAAANLNNGGTDGPLAAPEPPVEPEIAVPAALEAQEQLGDETASTDSSYDPAYDASLLSDEPVSAPEPVIGLSELDVIPPPSAKAPDPARTTGSRPAVLGQAGSFFKKKEEESARAANAPGASPNSSSLPGQLIPPSQLGTNPPSQFGSNPPSQFGKGASAFSKEKLDEIQAGAAAKPYSPTGLDSIKTPGSSGATNPGASDSLAKPDAIKAPGAEPGGKLPFSPSDLDSIPTPKKTGEAKIAPAFSDTDLDAIKPATPTPLPKPDKRVIAGKATMGSRAHISGPSDAGVRKLIVPGLALLFILGFFAFVAYFALFNQSSEVINPGLDKYVTNVFKTLDHKQTVIFDSNNHGQLIEHYSGVKAQQYDVKFRVFNENPIDEMRTLFGDYDKAVFLTQAGLGLKTETGAILYALQTTEGKTVEQMWNIADASQIYYKKYGHYPMDASSDPEEMTHLLPSLDFANPYSHLPELPAIQQLDWPTDKMPADVREVTPFEIKWRDGEPMSIAGETKGAIHCAQLGWPKSPPLADYKHPRSLLIDDFFIEGYDEYSQLIHTSDGKVLVIALKKDMDMTPETAPRMVPEKAKGPVTVVISPVDKPMMGPVLFRYGLWTLVFCLILTLWMNWPAIEAWTHKKRAANEGAIPPSNQV